MTASVIVKYVGEEVHDDAMEEKKRHLPRVHLTHVPEFPFALEAPRKADIVIVT
jgi:hypothetical protein